MHALSPFQCDQRIEITDAGQRIRQDSTACRDKARALPVLTEIAERELSNVGHMHAIGNSSRHAEFARN